MANETISLLGRSCKSGLPRRLQAFSPEGGFSLVEVLVSIVVLTFGMLGMVGMQAAALHANYEARLQSAGMLLARELGDMIRGNKAVGTLPADNNPYLIDVSSPLPPTTASYCLNAATGTCASNTDIADAQMTEWLGRVDADLPGARVVSCYDTDPFDANGVPQWNCTAGANAVIVIKLGWSRGSTNKSNKDAAAIERATDLGSVPTIILPVTPGV